LGENNSRFINNNPKYSNKILHDYNKCIKSKSKGYKYGCFHYYSDFEVRPEFKANNVLTSNNSFDNSYQAIAFFWFRRYLDGTHKEVYNILKLMYSKYN